MTFGEELFFKTDSEDCVVQSFEDGQFKSADKELLRNRQLYPRPLPRRPHLVAFKVEEKVYIAKASCLSGKSYEQRPDQIITTAKKSVEKRSVKTKVHDAVPALRFRDQNYFFELDVGSLKILDGKPAASDYNKVFPSVTSNPTSWGETTTEAYKSGLLINIAGGKKISESTFFVLKTHIESGEKNDTVTLTDINTSATQTGTWTYKDSLINSMIGFRHLMTQEGRWIPTIGFYGGLSYLSTTMSDSISSYKLSSLGLAALAELGIDYLYSAHFALGANFGYEYLGAKSLKFADESKGTNFKTDFKYDNVFLSLGLKIYF